MANQCEIWAGLLARHQPTFKLILTGPTGIGKTALLNAVHTYALNISTMILRTDLGFNDVRQAWNGRVPRVNYFGWAHLADPRNELTFEDACRDDILFLDDIGVEVDQYRTGAPTERLGRLLSARATKYTMITTNVPVAKWRTHWDARVEDRLMRDSMVWVCDAKNFNQWKAENL